MSRNSDSLSRVARDSEIRVDRTIRLLGNNFQRTVHLGTNQNTFTLDKFSMSTVQGPSNLSK